MRSLVDLARRYYSYDGPDVARTEPLDHGVGDSATFSLTDLDAVSDYEITATVRAVSEHAYFFVEDGEAYSEADLDQIVADFDSFVWPTITGAFGNVRSPGVDGDPRITILNANLRGAGGYVSASDAVPKAVYSRSNEREMIYLDAYALTSPGATFNSLAAHELQHLILQNYDDGEESWVNEGMSEVAWEMVGGGNDGVWEYLGRPDTQLNAWAGTSINYAASELFLSYLLDHYGGRENASDLSSVPEDGVEGVDAFLRSHGKTFDEVFADFAAANLLDAADGPYSHPNFNGRTSDIGEIAVGEGGNGGVSQFATDYVRTDAGTFTFDGSDETTHGIPELEGAFWWSDRGDGINTRLTRAVDLSDVSFASIEFDAWFDIEEGWDYAYVAVSTDDGETWTAVGGQHTTHYDPIDVSYGPGYTGRSEGWVHEVIDLAAYTGEEILLRFELVTDDSQNEIGLAVDNVEIAAVGLLDMADAIDEWETEGFRRVAGPLAQSFMVQIIDDDGIVARPPLDSENVLSFTLDRPATIAISATTPKTNERASYTWSLQ